MFDKHVDTGSSKSHLAEAYWMNLHTSEKLLENTGLLFWAQKPVFLTYRSDILHTYVESEINIYLFIDKFCFADRKREKIRENSVSSFLTIVESALTPKQSAHVENWLEEELA